MKKYNVKNIKPSRHFGSLPLKRTAIPYIVAESGGAGRRRAARFPGALTELKYQIKSYI
jgi:hypothetical protein